jgi:hypothetical protein
MAGRVFWQTRTSIDVMRKGPASLRPQQNFFAAKSPDAPQI